MSGINPIERWNMLGRPTGSGSGTHNMVIALPSSSDGPVTLAQAKGRERWASSKHFALLLVDAGTPVMSVEVIPRGNPADCVFQILKAETRACHHYDLRLGTIMEHVETIRTYRLDYGHECWIVPADWLQKPVLVNMWEIIPKVNSYQQYYSLNQLDYYRPMDIIWQHWQAVHNGDKGRYWFRPVFSELNKQPQLYCAELGEFTMHPDVAAYIRNLAGLPGHARNNAVVGSRGLKEYLGTHEFNKYAPRQAPANEVRVNGFIPELAAPYKGPMTAADARQEVETPDKEDSE